MNRIPEAFFRARLASLYLLSLAGIYGMELALEPRVLGSFFGVAWPPLVLAAATILGAGLGDGLASLVDRQNRARLALLGWAGSGSGLGFVLLGALAGENGQEALRMGCALLKILQPFYLLLSGIGRGHLGTLANALGLTIAAALGGGPAAAAAVTAYASILVFFFAVDHPTRLALEYSTVPARAARAIRSSILSALLMAAFLGVFFVLFPCRPYAPLTRVSPAAARGLPREQILELCRELALVGLISVAGFFLLLRYLGGQRRDREVPIPVEKPPARHYAETRSESALPEGVGPAKGCRARVVRLYVRFLSDLARRGLRRRPSETPGEFARRLAPAPESGLLLSIFSRARYGYLDVSEEDVRAARRASSLILAQSQKPS